MFRTENIETFQNIDKIHYIYWTGGYDSTFRLCEMLINEHKIVQPIYINFNLDNDCKECDDKLWYRRNRRQEMNAMKRIRKAIINKYPNFKNKLLETDIVNNDIIDKNFEKYFIKKFFSNNLWPKKRLFHQYYFLSKYALYNKIKIDTGVLGMHKKSKLYQYLSNHLVKIENNWEIQNNSSPISHLRFPLFNRTKKALLDKAKLYSFDDILKLSWSCWFPKNDKPCGICPMCRERIINHPNLENEQKIDLMETFDNPPTYMFWNGDFNSTFRLCQLLLEEKKQVKTIYISDKNNKVNLIKKIRAYLTNKYPDIVNLLLPTMNFKQIRKTLNNKTEYSEMAQVCSNLNKDIEVCIGNEHPLHTKLKGKMKCNYRDCSTNYKRLKTDLNHSEKYLEIFKRFIFPLYYMDKKDMHMHAKNKGYNDVLKLTKNCRYPSPNGTSCGKCLMCQERII